jgi:hypothetical protein
MTAANAVAKNAELIEVSPLMAALFVRVQMQRSGAMLGGAYPTPNPGWAMMTDEISTSNFIVGDFIVISTATNLDFDVRLKLKEDYDYCCQHLAEIGVVCRCNRLMVKATHYTNPGGAVASRSDENEKKAIAILHQKWPGIFRRHPSRGENEVLMVWRTRRNPVRPALPGASQSWNDRRSRLKRASELAAFDGRVRTGSIIGIRTVGTVGNRQCEYMIKGAIDGQCGVWAAEEEIEDEEVNPENTLPFFNLRCSMFL